MATFYIALTEAPGGGTRAVGTGRTTAAAAIADARAFAASARWGAYVVERRGRRGRRVVWSTATAGLPWLHDGAASPPRHAGEGV